MAMATATVRKARKGHNVYMYVNRESSLHENHVVSMGRSRQIALHVTSGRSAEDEIRAQLFRD